MVRFKAYNGSTKRVFVGFGLSERNIQMLKMGKPIFVDGNSMNTVIDYFIFYGRTEKEMHEMMKEFISANTDVFGVPDEEIE
jgi:hypothetical protein